MWIRIALRPGRIPVVVVPFPRSAPARETPFLLLSIGGSQRNSMLTPALCIHVSTMGWQAVFFLTTQLILRPEFASGSDLGQVSEVSEVHFDCRCPVSLYRTRLTWSGTSFADIS